MTASKLLVSALALTSLSLAPRRAHAGGIATEKKGGITVTVEADGKKDNDGELVHIFQLKASSSNRKDDKQVDLTIHLFNDGGELTPCKFQLTVGAAETATREILCFEPADWTHFQLELDRVGAPE